MGRRPILTNEMASGQSKTQCVHCDQSIGRSLQLASTVLAQFFTRMSSKHINYHYNVTLPPPLTVWNASHMIKVLCNPNPYATTMMLLCFTCAQYLTSPSRMFYKVCINSLICSKTLKVCNLILQCCKCPKVKYMCSYIQNIIALWLQIYILLPSSSFGFSVT